MSLTCLAKRYAASLYEAWETRYTQAEIGDLIAELEAALRALSEDKSLWAFLTSERFYVREKLDFVQANFSKWMRRDICEFLIVLIRQRHLDLWRPVMKAITSTHDKRTGVIPVTITAAGIMASEEISRIKDGVRRMLNVDKTSCDFVFDVRPDILGGLIIRVGNHACDLSLRSFYDQLKAHIQKG